MEAARPVRRAGRRNPPIERWTGRSGPPPPGSWGRGGASPTCVSSPTCSPAASSAGGPLRTCAPTWSSTRWRWPASSVAPTSKDSFVTPMRGVKADSTGRRNIQVLGVLMGRPAGWMKALTGRSPMKSPGAPAHRREVERAFWGVIATGVTTEAAAEAVGVASAVGCRWFRHRGGMPIDVAPASGRYLSFSEREEIALLRAQGGGVRVIARRLGRDPATISRELRRNAATRGGKLDYRASVAQWKADLVAQRPKAAKLATNDRLRDYVQDRLSGHVQRPDGTPVEGPATPA